MNILINCSNLKVGGGLQVADSICCSLKDFSNHRFYVVLSSYLSATYNRIPDCNNIKKYIHNIENNMSTLFFGRDYFMDSLVDKEKIDVTITVFGPSRWQPKTPHLCGFARAHLVLTDSPYFYRIRGLQRFRMKINHKILKYYFKRSSSFFYTENSSISEKLQKLIKNSQVYTITNYYNQIFDTPDKWGVYKLPDFEGVTILTVTAPYPHKNLPIFLEIAKIMRCEYPEFKFRFVLTIERHDYPIIPNDLQEYFLFVGKVDISKCPSLYQQADVMCQPSLLECFTATYPEAMRMEVPIVTTDIEFAHGLCGDAAIYYEPLSAKAAVSAILRVSFDMELRNRLKKEGLVQLRQFDNYNQRTKKLISIAEQIVNLK